MPKLWNETIQEHRQAVRDAALDATAALVTEHGVAAVTMSRIAQETGIGRATLYKYFPDVEAILLAWHERQVGWHVRELEQVRDRAGTPGRRLRIVLATYALLSREHVNSAVAASLHRSNHTTAARHHVAGLLEPLIAEAAAVGEVRTDVPPHELAQYCLHALGAADVLTSKAAIQRLVTVVLAGMGSH